MNMWFKSALVSLALAAAPGHAVVPISGFLGANTDVFVANGNLRQFRIGQDDWTGTPRNLENEFQQSVRIPGGVGRSEAQVKDTATWRTDGLGGRIEFQWTWYLQSDLSDLVGASYEGLANWSYTFRATGNGRFIIDGEYEPSPSFLAAPNQPFGLSGWAVTMNGTTILDLIDPVSYAYRQNSVDVGITAGETYTVSIVNRSNIAGRNFMTQPFYYGRALGAFGWQIEEEAVPEPASWALMILGFFGTGAAIRRQRSPVCFSRAAG